MLPSELSISSDAGIGRFSMEFLHKVLAWYTMKSLVRIVSVGIFLIVAGTVVCPFLRMLFAHWRASSIQFPPALLTNRKVLVAAWIGTVYHTVAIGVANMAFGDHLGVDRIDIHRYSIVKYVTLAFEVFPSSFHSVLDDTAVQLVDVLKTLFQEKC